MTPIPTHTQTHPHTMPHNYPFKPAAKTKRIEEKKKSYISNKRVEKRSEREGGEANTPVKGSTKIIKHSTEMRKRERERKKKEKNRRVKKKKN